MPDVFVGNKGINDMIRELLDAPINIPDDPVAKFSAEKLTFFYKWHMSKKKRDEICNILQKHFEQVNRLLIV